MAKLSRPAKTYRKLICSRTENFAYHLITKKLLERSQKFNEHEYQSIPCAYLNETLIGHDFALHFIISFG